jgi:hypothetical protein
MIVVILASILGLWLAGNRLPVGWGLAAAAHLLCLPYALSSGQPGFALTVAAFGLVHLRNYRKNRAHLHDGLMYVRRKQRRL